MINTIPPQHQLDSYEESVLGRLVDAIRMASVLPLKDTLWTITDVSEYLTVSVSTARKLANQPRFPRARSPGGGHSRWVAAEVVEWAKK